jgi:hypothetical protein
MHPKILSLDDGREEINHVLYLHVLFLGAEGPHNFAGKYYALFHTPVSKLQ